CLREVWAYITSDLRRSTQCAHGTLRLGTRSGRRHPSMLTSLEIVRGPTPKLWNERRIAHRHRELDATCVAPRRHLQPGQIERAVIHVGAAEHHPGAMAAHGCEQAVRRPSLGGQQDQHAVRGRTPANGVALEWRNRYDVRGRLATGLRLLSLELGGCRP